MSIPDAQIHPVATGNAAITVEKHQAEQELVLWAGWVRNILDLSKG
jgi:glutathione S-transferase